MPHDQTSQYLQDLQIRLENHEAIMGLRNHVNDTPEALDALTQLAVVNGGHFDQCRPALEMESIQSQGKSTIGQIIESMGQGLQKSLDDFHFQLTLFNVQGGRVRKLRDKISHLDNGMEYRVTVPINKYMRFGEDMGVPRTGTEYLQQYRLLHQVIVATAKELKPMTHDDVGSWWVNLWKLITLKINEHMVERTNALIRHVESVVGMAKLAKHRSSSKYQDVYASEMLLGGIQLTAKLPPERQTSTDDMRSTMESLRNTSMYMYRLDKVRLSTVTDGSVSLVFKGRELRELYDLVTDIYDEVDNMLAFGIKWATRWGRTVRSGSLQDRDTEFDDYASQQAFWRNSRVMAKYNAIIYDSVSTTYHTGIGNVKQALTILEKL